MAKKMTFNIDGLMNLDAKGMISSLEAIKKSMSNLSGGDVKRLDTLLARATDQTKDLELTSKRTFKNTSEVKAANKAYENLEKTLKQINYVMSNNDFKAGADNIQKAIKAGQKELKELEKMSNAFATNMHKVFNQFKGQHKISLTADDLIEASEKAENIGKMVGALTRSSNALKIDTTELENAEAHMKNLGDQLAKLRVEQVRETGEVKLYATGSAEHDKLLTSLEARRVVIAQLDGQHKTAIANVNRLTREFDKQESAMKQQKQTNTQVIDELKKLSAEYINLQGNVDFEQIFGKDLAPLLTGLTTDAEGLKDAIVVIANSTEDIKTEALEKMSVAFEAVGVEAEKASEHLDGVNDSVQTLTETDRQIVSLRNNMMQFFSLTSGWRLLQRAMREAHKTVKELDAAMTEIAVVSEYSLDQIWAMRQGYTDAATDMGAKTLDLINATKLYVQQGLDLQNAQKIGIETIKMARIANLDGAEATSLMTAAIRGFHMELTEANKVNDVYSVLAAKSAADTREIAVAMSKTASIASSAGSEFESMSAFLTQIIETTREAPETAGTAMKTIIARFQELKKPMDEIGEIDGEIVDANAIETALRSAGVALRDMKGEFRDFDDVIFELSGKWDELDLMTQRYIATMAAGSRQQSRFIALVSNHARLMELTGYATNSAGAAADQFAKTQESLQAKVNRLTNAMDQFWTNLADSSVIKGAIDSVTLFMNAINGIIKAFSDLPGAAGKAGGVFATLALTLGGFKTAQKTIDIFFNSIVGKSLQAGREAGLVFGESTNKALDKSLRGTRGVINKAFDSLVSSANIDTVFKDMTHTMTKEIREDLKSFDSIKWSGQIFTQADNLNSIFTKVSGTSKQLRGTLEDQIPSSLFSLMSRKEALMAVENARLGKNVELEQMKRHLEYRKATLEKKGLKSLLTKVGIMAQNNYAEAQGNILKATSISLGKIDVATTWERVKAHMGLNTQMLIGMGVIAGVIAGLTLLIYITYKVIKAFQDNTIESRLKATKERTDEAAEAANKAKEAYDQLLGDQDRYKELQGSLDNLVEGTNEWRDALIEANDQVLELLRTYPILASHIERTGDGRLTISEEGHTAMKEQGRRRVETTQMVSLGAQLDHSLLKREAAMAATIGETQNTKMLKSLIDAQKQQNDYIFKQQDGDYPFLVKLAETTDYTVEGLVKMKDEFDNFTQTLAKTEREIENQAGLFFTSVLDPKDAQSNLGKAITNIMQKGIEGKGIGLQVKAMESQLKDSGASVPMPSQKRQELLEQYGISTARGTSEKSALQELYKEMSGEDVIPDDLKKIADLRKAVAELAIFDDITNKMEDFYNKAETLGEVESKKITAIFSDAGKGLTRAMVGGDTSYEVLQDLMEDLGFETMDQLADVFGLTAEKLEEILNEGDALARSRYEAGDAALGKFEGLVDIDKIKEFGDSVSSETYQALIEKLTDVFTAGGSVSDIISNIDDVNSAISKLKQEDQVAIIEEIMSADWTDKGALEGLEKSLLEISDEVPKEALDIFIAKMIDLNSAIYKVDVDKLTNELGTMGKTISEIKEREPGDYQFTADQYESVLAQDEELASEFVQNLDGTYTYIGNSMQDLITAIKGNTLAKLEETQKTLEAQLRMAEILEGREGFKGALESDEGAQKDFLRELLYALPREDLGALGISGLGSGTQVDNLEAEKITEILERLFALSLEADGIMMKLEQTQEATQTYDYGERDAAKLGGGMIIEGNSDSLDRMSDALIKQARTAEITESAIKEYKEAMEDSTKENKNAIIAELANAVSMRESQKALGETMTTIDELMGVLENVPDSASQLEYVSEALDSIGLSSLEVTEENLPLVISLLENLADGSFEAYQELFNLTAEEWGLTITAEGRFQALQEDIDYTKQKYIDMVDTMIEEGMLVEEVVDTESNINYVGSLMPKVMYRMIDDGTPVPYITYEVVTDNSQVTSGMTVIRPKKAPEIKRASRGLGGSKRTPSKPKTPKAKSGGKKKEKEKKEEEPWKNTYDWLYNLVEKTNKAIRDRNRLEKDYNRLLKARVVSSDDLYDNMEMQVRNLERQKSLLSEQMSGRITEKRKVEAEYSDVRKYANYNENLGYVEINWNQLEKLSGKKGNQEEAKRADEYIKELERIAEEVRTLDDSLYDIEDQIDDILLLGKEEYLALEDRIYDAVVQAQRDLIDEMSKINDSINNANAKILSKLQEGIADNRRLREDEKTEQSIAAKEERLAFLRQDTSGANQLEILRLEEELDQARQDYTDKLIDDKITDLQKQNDAAAEQRQMQIDLANEQLEVADKHGELWEEVRRLTESGVNIQGQLVKKSELEILLRKTEGFQGMSKIQQMEWTKGLEDQIGTAATYIRANDEVLNSIFKVLKPTTIAKEPAKSTTAASTKTTSTSSSSSSTPAKTVSYYPKITPAQVKAKKLDPNSIVDTLKTGGIDSSRATREKIAKANSITNYSSTAAQNIKLLKLLNEGKLKRYKKGGLVDFTGPAWVDGTKSAPEGFLDAQDTRNLIALKNILESLRKSSGGLGDGMSGDNYFDIRVQVGSLSNDYDVDALTNRIKRQIYDDASYRNVQVVRGLR